MGIFSYSPQREGKGVGKDSPKLKRPFLFFQLFYNNFWDFIKLSMIFFVTCIPIITIPASICGMTYVSKCYAIETHTFLLSDYFEYFKKYFFKSIVVSIVNLIVAFSLYIVISNYNTITQFQNLLVPIVIINLLMLVMDFYIFPMLITYDIPLWAVFKNSFILSMVKFPMNLLIALIFVAIVACAFGFYPIIGMVLTPFILTGFLGFLATFYVWPTILKNMSED